MNTNSYILWTLLLIVSGVCIYWHLKENKHLAKLWDQKLDEQTALNFERFAWARSIQLFSVLGCLVLLVVMYDWQLSLSRSDIELLNNRVIEEKAELTNKIQQPLPSEPPQVTNSMLDVYNADEADSSNSTATDILKRRYEEILVTYFFLKKCNIAQSTDYHVITSALSHEMASINAPGRLQNDILTAARGSYKEMYSQTRCDGSGMPALQAQYSDYITTITKNYADQ